MSTILERKCSKCKSVIEIDINDIKNVVYYNDSYYHIDCFYERAKYCIKRNTSTALRWQNALDNIAQYTNEAKDKLWHWYWRDRLNEWLLNNYNIADVPKSFFTTIEDIENGTYRHRRCKSIPIQDMFELWVWQQQDLNQIAKSNKMKHTGPQNDNDRLLYDLAILRQKYPAFLQWRDKQKSNEIAAVQETKTPKINYNSLEKRVLEKQKEAEGIGDISDLLDELF